jgi:alkanesulfonate monooxygenase SsuD/methylene tetrahydromethanopterin reductase-like flavin-dependent oxidoreductase (luciferase family)
MDYGQPVRFGVFVTPEATDRPLQVAALADELGFDLVGVQDHPYQRRFYDTWTLLTAIAMRTQRITVFPDVANLPLRPPAMLAKAAATLDLLSAGRFELGIGAGGFWNGIQAYDGPVRTPGESVSAVEEAIQVMRLLWSGQHGIRFEGKFYSLRGAHSGPVPAHPIGIWLGAYKPRMLSIVGRLADGWVPSYGYVKEAELLEGNGRIDEAAVAAGRDPRTIRRVLNAGYMEAEQLVTLVTEHGMDTFVIADEPDEMRRFVKEVAPKVREEVESRRSHRAD